MKSIVAAIILILIALPAIARNVALVIGNSSYSSVEHLENPLNDARAVSEALELQGFEVVQENDLTYAQMRRAFRKFRSLADSAEFAVVYYAGHGIEISGQNYLVPIDARLEDERDASVELINVDVALQQMSRASKMKMLVLDACRNNPFLAKVKREKSGRNVVGRGLGQVTRADADTLIAYAAAAGDVTPDGAPGGHSPFTKAFLKALDEPPADVRKLLGIVRDEMRSSTPEAAPFVYNSLGGSDYIINPNSAAVETAAIPLPTATELDELRKQNEIYTDFGSAQLENDTDAWRSFLTKYEADQSHPLYLMALGKFMVAGGNGVPAAHSLSEAVQDTDILEMPLAEDEKGAKTENRQLAALAKPLEKDPDSDGEPLISASVPASEYDKLARRMQLNLEERGCYSGAIDGILGKGSRRAVLSFTKTVSKSVELSDILNIQEIEDILAVLEEHPEMVCPKPIPVAKTIKRAISKSVEPVRKPVAKAAPKTSNCVLFQGKKRCY